MHAVHSLQPFQQNCDRIIVIDDEAVSFTASILSLQGYNIQQVPNAELALVELYAQSTHLIVSKPITLKTGEPFSQHVRSLTNYPYTPILLIADHDSTDLVQGLDSGADDFLRKPVEVDELLARVRSLLRMKHSIDSREHMTQVREEFLSRLTHDLRTPLVAADRMFLRLIQGKYGVLNDEVLQILRSMQSNNQELLQMASTLLDIYRYEAGSKTLSFTVFNLYELLTSVIQELSPLAENKSISLQLSADSQQERSDLDMTASWSFQGAKLEIRRMLTNLISNAIQFTNQGTVKTELHSSADYYRIRIQDSGCGISEADLPHIFDRFYQGHGERSGYGLGLNLVQQIVSAHDGHISVQSQPGEGSCFELYLPTLSGHSLPVPSSLPNIHSSG